MHVIVLGDCPRDSIGTTVCGSSEIDDVRLVLIFTLAILVRGQMTGVREIGCWSEIEKTEVELAFTLLIAFGQLMQVVLLSSFLPWLDLLRRVVLILESFSDYIAGLIVDGLHACIVAEEEGVLGVGIVVVVGSGRVLDQDISI